MKIRKQIKNLELLVMSAILFFIVSGRAISDEANQQLFDLKVAVVLDAPKTTLAFTIKNNSKTTLTMVGPGFNWSPIIIVTPSGKVKVEKTWIDVFKQTELKPSESKTWKSDYLATALRFHELDESGLYRISWKLEESGADDKRVDYISNEIFVLKE